MLRHKKCEGAKKGASFVKEAPYHIGKLTRVRMMSFSDASQTSSKYVLHTCPQYLLWDWSISHYSHPSRLFGSISTPRTGKI